MRAIGWPTPHKDPVINTGSKPCWARRITPSVMASDGQMTIQRGGSYIESFSPVGSSFKTFYHSRCLESLESRRCLIPRRGGNMVYGRGTDAIGHLRGYCPSICYVCVCVCVCISANAATMAAGVSIQKLYACNQASPWLIGKSTQASTARPSKEKRASLLICAADADMLLLMLQLAVNLGCLRNLQLSWHCLSVTIFFRVWVWACFVWTRIQGDIYVDCSPGIWTRARS